MLGPGTFEQSLQLMQFIGISGSDSFEPLNLGRQLIYNAPGDHLLPSDPLTSFLVVCLSKEEFQVEEISEAASLEDLNLNAWQ